MAKLKASRRKREAKRKDTFVTMMKAIVFLCLVNGFAWVWCSYILAFQGQAVIAESLSKVALTEIIAVVGIYAFKALIENLSKNNQWPDKPGKVKGKETVIPEFTAEPPSSEDSSASDSDFVFDWSNYGGTEEENGGRI